MPPKCGLSVYQVRSKNIRIQIQQLLFSAVNCTEAPEMPPGGTWEWDKSIGYATEAHYTCGPYGNFIDAAGELYETLVSVCSWNKSWTPSEMDPCVAVACPVIPFPPEDSGMILMEDADNMITLETESSKYSPRLPVTLKFPGAELCTDGGVMLVVGTIPKKSRRPLQIVFYAEDGFDEAFHIVLNISFNYIERWGVYDNVSTEHLGQPGDGTSIDYDEPFVLRC